MAPLIGLIGGALLGAYRANKRGGNRKDIAQYATAFAIAGGLIGLFIGIIIARNAV